jgi:hypothetical protein
MDDFHLLIKLSLKPVIKWEYSYTPYEKSLCQLQMQLNTKTYLENQQQVTEPAYINLVFPKLNQ